MYKDNSKIEIGWMNSSEFHGTVAIFNTDWSVWQEGTYEYGELESAGRGYFSSRNFSLKKIFVKQ